MFSYEIDKIFKNTFLYRTSLLWWLLLAVNSVNQWKHTLKVYATEKEMIYLNGTSKVSVSRYRVIIWGFPNTIGKVGKVAGKSLKQSSRTVLYKRCSWKFLKPLVFSCEFCEFLSKNASFYRTPLVAASVKACNFTKIRLLDGCFLWTF